MILFMVYFRFFFFNLALQCRTQLRELGSDLGTRHLLQARRSAEHRLRSYVEHNSGCDCGYEPARGTPRSTTGTLPSPQPALLALPFMT